MGSGETGVFRLSGERHRLMPLSSRSYFSGAEVPPVAYPEGFQGNEIPIDGELVAKLVHRRLSLAEEADD
jgi:hypothetical protein